MPGFTKGVIISRTSAANFPATLISLISDNVFIIFLFILVELNRHINVGLL